MTDKALYQLSQAIADIDGGCATCVSYFLDTSYLCFSHEERLKLSSFWDIDSYPFNSVFDPEDDADKERRLTWLEELTPVDEGELPEVPNFARKYQEVQSKYIKLLYNREKDKHIEKLCEDKQELKLKIAQQAMEIGRLLKELDKCSQGL